MEEDLQGNSGVSVSFFEKVKSFFQGAPWYVWVFILVGVITSLLIAIYYLAPGLFKKITEKITKKEKIENIWSAYTTTPPPILPGKQTYKISGGNINLPLITEVTIDPQDAKQGQNQTVTVKANGPTPIKEVIVVLRLDGENNFEYKLAQSSGSPTNGEWKGSWKFPHTYNKTYRLNIKARNENNLGNTATITIR